MSEQAVVQIVSIIGCCIVGIAGLVFIYLIGKDK